MTDKERHIYVSLYALLFWIDLILMLIVNRPKAYLYLGIMILFIFWRISNLHKNKK